MAVTQAARLEERTQAIARDLYERARAEGGGFFRGDRLAAQLMDWAIRHDETRLRLFRLVDVLPALGSADEVARHLREYFGGQQDPLGGLLRLGVGLAGAGRLGAHAAAAALHRAVEQLARSFIAGATPQEALRAVEGFRRRGEAFTLDVLGEATLGEAEADAYQKRYLELLEVLGERARRWEEHPLLDRAPWGPVPRVNLSVKLSALYSQLDPLDPEGSARAVLRRLLPVAEQARRYQAHLHVDMEDYHLKDLTLEIFRRLLFSDGLRDWRHLGIVLQAYLQDSPGDARTLLAWARERGTPFTVRLVKGAYWDHETAHAGLKGWPVPVFEQKEATDANFEDLTERLLHHADEIDLALGSHNVRSVARALALAETLDLPRGTLEFQFLYGMAVPLRRALVERSERVRVYTPVGELIPGMAYLVRRLLENTSNTSFLRQGFAGGADPARLFADPRQALASRQPAPSPARPPDEPAPFHNEPHTDFARAEARERLRAALDQVRRQLGRRYPLLIGGRPVETGDDLVSHNPARPREVIGRVASAGTREADLAVAAAREAFPAWSERRVQERAAILRQAAARLRERRYELAAWIILEAGKPWREADGDVAEAIDFIEYYARQALSLQAPRSLGGLLGESNHYLRVPRGVAAIIAPWNFPLAILTGMTAAALVTGNTVVVKPAEATPVIAAKLVEVLHEAGVPPGAVNYLPGPGDVAGEQLVGHPDVRIIAFTGSRAVGTHIVRQAAQVRPGQRHMKRVIAELGGKNAIVVDDDADLDEAVAGVVSSAFAYAGQKCSACSRAIVLAPLHDRFLERLVEAARSLRLGPAEDPGTYVGPVISEEQRERIAAYIDQGRREGRAVLEGEVPGSLKASGGHYIAPVIFAEVDTEAVVAREEIFGPVLVVMRARSFDQALEMAMESDYALTGGIFSRSPSRIAKARRALRVGNLYVNRPITGSLVGRQPFGGLRLSGVGYQAGGPDYLLQFVENRTLTEHTLRRGFASETLAGQD